ncbi:subtilisin-like protein [Lentinula raphanica]|nr:subtilisin-like protein [Lentinula raphanica]
MSVHDRRDAVPKGYSPMQLADYNSMIQFRISLNMGNRSGLEDALNRASNPDSESYGQWLSQEDIQYYAAPSREALHSVRQWLSSYNIDSKAVTASGDWIKFSAPVGTANTMLNANYKVYEHTASGKQLTRTLEYSVPDDLQEHIRAIHPTTSFYHSGGGRVISLSGHHKSGSSGTSGDLKKASSSSTSSAAAPSATLDFTNCNKTVTPACLQKLYGIPSAQVNPSTNSTLGVSAFGGQDANKADLASFLKLFRPDMPSNTTFATQLLDDATNSQNRSDAGIEANLDIQYTVGVANGIPTTFVDIGNDNHDGDDGGFLDIINDLLAEPNPPLVLTTSYGVAADESGLSKSLTFAMCDAFMKLTARGVSILYATGDGGVASSPGSECDNEPFLAAWPTCPYATLVGATADFPEKGADLSAGGFSNYFDQPSWQQKAVATYLDAIGDDLYKGRFNRSGRGYPDVSAQGEKIQIIQSGELNPVGGTSASSPIFASVVALLNDELLSKGKAPLGFMNPWIYAHPEAFFDITNGSNPGCGTDGFPALEGWDPVTGVGSPNYQAMRKALGLS